MDHADRIAVNVAQPADVGVRRNLQARSRDMQVMPLARAQHSAMLPKGNRGAVMILSVVDNADSLHASAGHSSIRGERLAPEPNKKPRQLHADCKALGRGQSHACGKKSSAIENLLTEIGAR